MIVLVKLNLNYYYYRSFHTFSLNENTLIKYSKCLLFICMLLEQSEKIKSLMAGFVLPTTHLPAWAMVIPEDEWKTQLKYYLHNETSLYSNKSRYSS